MLNYKLVEVSKVIPVKDVKTNDIVLVKGYEKSPYRVAYKDDHKALFIATSNPNDWFVTVFGLSIDKTVTLASPLVSFESLSIGDVYHRDTSPGIQSLKIESHKTFLLSSKTTLTIAGEAFSSTNCIKVGSLEQC
jgi:hypothetical protein